MNNAELERLFIERYGDSTESIRYFFAPGRVNLIGDHTDYNGGLVFPCAIHYGTTLLIRPGKKKNYQLASTNLSNRSVNGLQWCFTSRCLTHRSDEPLEPAR